MRSLGRSDPAAPHSAALDQLLAMYSMNFSFVLFRGGKWRIHVKTSHPFLLTDFVAFGNVLCSFFHFSIWVFAAAYLELFLSPSAFQLLPSFLPLLLFHLFLPKLPSFTNHLLCHFCPFQHVAPLLANQVVFSLCENMNGCTKELINSWDQSSGAPDPRYLGTNQE